MNDSVWLLSVARSLCTCASFLSRSVARVATFLRNETILKNGFSRSRLSLLPVRKRSLSYSSMVRSVLYCENYLGDLNGVRAVTVALGCKQLVDRFHKNGMTSNLQP